MLHDHLGLFDTPPDRRQVRFALLIVGLLVAALVLIFPVRDVRLRPIETLAPVVDVIIFVGEVFIATLLYAQASVFRSRALTALATGYVLSALLVLAHALAFPGGFGASGLLGGDLDTAAWIYAFRRAAFPSAAIVYVLYKQADSQATPRTERRAPRILLAVAAAVAAAAALTVLATFGQEWLPPHQLNHFQDIFAFGAMYQLALLALFIVATVMLFRRRESVLDLWMLVAFSGWLAQSLLLLTLHARYTAGWYSLFAISLASHLVVLLALVTESNRLYARLAVSTAAWRRERETRLMSIDAVAAAVSHEIGQPLTGVSTHARAGLNWLTRETPDVEMAIQSLRATVDAGRRTTEALKSVRGMFAKRPGAASEFNLDDLARATAALLDAELVSRKITVQFTLDEALPPILAERVQIQRVLVNLMTNAIESVGAARGRARRIVIRSSLMEDQHVLLEICDNGVGIDPEALPTIFEAFVSTKAGAGLGLWLSRTIVESNGGHLWATPEKPHGATFHLRLPCAGT